MAGIALKRSMQPCFHNGPYHVDGGITPVDLGLFSKVEG